MEFLIVYMAFSYIFVYSFLRTHKEVVNSRWVAGSIALVIFAPITMPLILGIILGIKLGE